MEIFYDNDLLEAGIDEVARGTLAGPVFAAAVILPKDFEIEVDGLVVKDSKKLTRQKRDLLRGYIEENAIDFSVASVDNNQIDQLNILNATYLAMHKAIKGLNVTPEFLLVDGNNFKPYYDHDHDNELIDHMCVIKGDSKYAAIACASILAKVYHDDYIDKICDETPELNRYNWKSNMCYGTVDHLSSIKQYGITEHHRKTFGICKEYS
jgi:ribonuclease HII